MNDRQDNAGASRGWSPLVARLRARHSREIVAFLVVGCSNTVLTYVTYLGLLHLMHYRWAYTGAFIVGLLYTGLLNIRVTFAHHPTLIAWIVFAAYYAAYWVFSLALLHVLVEGLGVDKRYGPLLLLPVVIPINFLITRLIVHRFARARS
jgi:putative flippase GtrA